MDHRKDFTSATLLKKSQYYFKLKKLLGRQFSYNWLLQFKNACSSCLAPSLKCGTADQPQVSIKLKKSIQSLGLKRKLESIRSISGFTHFHIYLSTVSHGPSITIMRFFIRIDHALPYQTPTSPTIFHKNVNSYLHDQYDK